MPHTNSILVTIKPQGKAPRKNLGAAHHEALRLTQARRKLRKACRAVVALNRFAKALHRRLSSADLLSVRLVD